jgi:hypothetical protein
VSSASCPFNHTVFIAPVVYHCVLNNDYIKKENGNLSNQGKKVQTYLLTLPDVFVGGHWYLLCRWLVSAGSRKLQLTGKM